MTSETDLAVARKFLQKALGGEITEAVQLLDPDVTYYIPGSSKLSGEFQGPDAVARHTAEFMRLTDRRVDVLKWEDWLAGVSHVALVVQLRVQRNDMTETTRFIQLVSMSEGNKIRRIEVFFSNQAAIERFFS